MATEVEISRRQELLVQARARLERVLHGPRADELEASKAVRLLIGGYPNPKVADPDVYMRMVRHLLVGQPMDVLMRFADPSQGVMRDHPTFPPGPGEVAIWLEKANARHRAEEQRCRNEIETLTYTPEQIPAEERERRLEESKRLTERLSGPVVPHREIEWLKPESEQSPAHRAEAARARRCQAPDTAEQRAKLMETPLMQARNP